jgi:hypothetical protein
LGIFTPEAAAQAEQSGLMPYTGQVYADQYSIAASPSKQTIIMAKVNVFPQFSRSFLEVEDEFVECGVRGSE